jgi:hypothetical protein
MATPPRVKRLEINVPAEAQWFSDALPQINTFIQDTTVALQGGLTTSNLLAQDKTLDLTTADLPVTFNCTLGIPPSHISLGRAEVVTSGGTFSGAVDVSQWALLPGNRIQYSNIPGLSASTRYRLTLRIT